MQKKGDPFFWNPKFNHSINLRYNVDIIGGWNNSYEIKFYNLPELR